MTTFEGGGKAEREAEGDFAVKQDVPRRWRRQRARRARRRARYLPVFGALSQHTLPSRDRGASVLRLANVCDGVDIEGVAFIAADYIGK